MQTFLPYTSFRKSAQVLDYKRLGKQRIEAMQILKILVIELGGGDSGSRWQTHPAVNLWRNKEKELALYGIEICLEWRNRGFVDNQLSEFCGFYSELPACGKAVFSEELYSSHRAALLAKNPRFYRKMRWKEKPEIKYVWR